MGGAGGGGGSSFANGVNTSIISGVRQGAGLLTITYITNAAPATGSHAPASGTSWNHTAAQEFSLTATDTQGDAFTAEFVITPTGGGTPRTLTSGSTPSGQQATVTADPELAPGEYTWQARACDTLTACSSYTATRTLTVLANAAPSINASGPTEGTTWQHHSAQSFSVTATDPEADTYHAQIVVTPDGGGTPRTFVTTTGLSGQSVTANPDPRIEPGSYTWQARACDSLGACGEHSTARTLTVHANRAPATTLASPNDGGTWGYNATQTFTVSGTDPDGDSYSAEIEVTPSGGGTTRTLATAFTASGQEVSATMSPALSPGSYTWRARSCDTLALCGAFTASRSFTVSPNLAPTVSLVSPADGAKSRTAGPHAFTVSASDPDLDRYTAEVVVTPASGGASRTMTSGLTLSGQAVTLTASPALAAGSYTWKARACDQGAVCSSYTATRSLTVNDPPATPTIVQPGPDYLFEPGEAQQFRASAVDPEGDGYSVQVEVQNLAGTTQRTLTTSTGASGSVVGVTATPALAPGAYRWRARGCDTGSGVCGAYTALQGVTVHDVAGCPMVLVDGWFGDLYTRVRRGSGPGTVSVCFGTATANAPVQGGRLQISGLDGVAPSVTVVDAAACTPIDAGDPLRDIEAAGTRFRVDVRQQPEHVLICAYVGRDGAALAHFGVRVETPDTGRVPDVQVIPAAGLPPAPRGPLLVQRPSAACQLATGSVRVINANLFGEWVSIHAHNAAGATRLCGRLDGPATAGGVLELVPGSMVSSPVAVTPGHGPEDAGTPCSTQVFRDNGSGVQTLLTAATGDPLALCLRLRADTGHEVELTTVLDVSPSVPDATAVWRPDPA